MREETDRPGAGLYLHLPFCSAICPYCDFAVLTGRPRDRSRFVEGLHREIDLWAGEMGEFDTFYLGGGTPSLLEPEQLERVLDRVAGAFTFRTGSLGFLEANPEDADRARLRAWRRMGIRSLSLGVQSFDKAALRLLGRRHSPEQARRAVREALEEGFDTVSVDLIYGLPDQEAEGWRRDLEEAAGLGPHHLSCYQLTVHAGTHFGRRRADGRLEEMPDDGQAALFHLTHTALEDRGYEGYEVSNFAASAAHRSRHNQKYWTHAPYLGLGPSAHSFQEARRWWNARELADYEAALAEGRRPVAGGEDLLPRDMALEALMLGLRTREGLDLARFQARYGISLEERNAGLLDRYREEGFLRPAQGRLVPTLRGLAVADTLARGIEL